MDPLGVVLGALLLFYLPGFALLHALFPGRRYFAPFHVVAMPVLAIVASVAILVVVGSVLSFLPGGPTPDGKGWFQGRATGAPVLEIALASLTLPLLVVAWWRGAFALLARPVRRNTLALGGPRAEYDRGAPERGEPEEITLLRDLRLEEERLRAETLRVQRRARGSRDVGVRTALSEAAADLERERVEVAKRARDLERQAGERRYGVERPRWTMRRS